MSKGNILVIDDDFGIMDGLTTLLEDEGYQVTCAINGQLGYDTLKSENNQIDLILLDLMMPVMDGYQFREIQLKDPKLKFIPVIVLTAGTQNIDLLKKMDLAACLNKPIEIDVLLENLDKFIKPKQT